MGSKGQSTQSQVQTYTPNPAAAGAITDAMGRAQQTASLPFAIPQAPVAGFSPQQQQAFGIVGNAQGMALPYLNQAANYFQQSAAGPNVSQFFNPMADAVTSNLKDIFGQQNAQTTGQLTQAAGGVGADRIAVGQSELAKQQGLAAGQTLAGLYQPALSAALQEQNVLQGAGYGTAALGPAAQNSVLQGAQALLGTGGLQQQLQQAQLNAPYQQQLAQAAFPYQQSNFLTNAIASLAPGLGGTTAGQGTYTPPQPSIWSQILGGGLAGAGIIGATGGFGSNGWLTNAFTGNADPNPGSSANPLPGLSPSDYGAGYARGGSPNPYAIDLPRRADGSYGYDEGGTVSDEPIDISHGFIPQGQTAHIAPHIPQINLNPPQQQQSGGLGLGDVLKAGAQIATLFAKDGGSIPSDKMRKFDGHNPYAFFADGGEVTDAERALGYDLLRQGMGVRAPDSIPGGEPAPEPYRMTPPDAVAAWRNGVNADIGAGATAQGEGDLPAIITHGTERPASALAYSAPSPPNAAPVNPYAAPATAAPETAPDTSSDFAKSPWAALMAAGLGIMGGSSPFAGVNIGQGGLQGIKMLEQQRAAAQKDTTIEQAARRLEQEAKFHEDQYSRMTPYQKAQVEQHQKAAEFQQMQPVKVGTDVLGRDIYAKKDPVTGKYINIMTGKPVDEPTETPVYRIPGPQSANPEAEIPANAKPASGEGPAAADPTFLTTLDPAVAAQVKAVAEGRRMLNPRSKEDQALMRLVGQYDPSFDLVNYNARAKARQDFTSGKSAQNITSFNTAIGHLGTLDKVIDKLDNKDFPTYNRVANWLAEETGDTKFQKARAEFQNAKTAVTEELTRAFRGTGGNVHDIVEWDKSLNEASSPAALHQAVKTAIELLKSRIESVGDQYNRGMGTTKDPMQLLSKKAQDAVKSLEGEGGRADSAAKPDAATRFQQLTGAGMSKADAYAKMHDEGY